MRIFDITDINKPRQIAAVQTCRGSHTHTLVTRSEGHGRTSTSTGPARAASASGEELAELLRRRQPSENPNTALFSIDVIQVPLAAPEKARIVNRPRIFADPNSRRDRRPVGGRRARRRHAADERDQSVPRHHGVSRGRVSPPARARATASCSTSPIRSIPKRIDAVTDTNFAYWHSATFNNDGTKVIFTDEWGGGTSPRCRATDKLTWGADAIFDIVDRKMKFASYYKMPAPQTDQENCVAHNGSLIPVPGRDIMVQAWYQGGLSMFDFTDSANPVEIAYFDRGPVDAHPHARRRLLVDLLVQRPHLRFGDHARPRRLPAAARASSCRRTRSTRRI